MRLNHNVASLNILRTYENVLQKQSGSLQKISSGYKVSSAKDDPNVIAQSEKMKMQIRGLQAAGKNSQDGVSMLQTAEGGLNNMTEMLQRVKELVVKAKNGTNNSDEEQTIQKEIDSVIDGMNDMAESTEFNGVKILAAASDNEEPLYMPVGADTGDKVAIPVRRLTSDSLKIYSGGSVYTLDDLKSGGKLSVSDFPENSDNALNVVDNALENIISIRSNYGSLENRFESTLTNINEINEKMESADSNLTDADIAEESMEYAKDNILVQAGNAMMAQSNKFPQDILQILQNVKSR